MSKIVKNLTFQVLTAIAIGAFVGYKFPDFAKGKDMEFIGKYFIECVKQFIYVIIPITIIVGIAGMGDLKKVGRIGGKALIYFELVTTIALILGLIVANIIRPGDGLDTSKIKGGDISKYTKAAAEFSWLKFFQSNVTLMIVAASILVGVILNYTPIRQKVLDLLHIASKYVFAALGLLMRFAPIGAFAGMAFTIGKFGLTILAVLAKLMLTVYTTMFIFIFLILGSIMRYYGFSIWRFLGYIKEEILIVLGTSSSEAALPAIMKKLTSMGCKESVVGLVVPAGYSFNLDGTTIYLSMATIFLTQVFKVHLSYTEIFTLIGVLMVTSKGAAGVTGSGFIVLASTLSALHNDLLVTSGLPLLLGVDRFMSEARAITNIIGNAVATVVLAKNENVFDDAKMEPAYQKEKSGDYLY